MMTCERYLAGQAACADNGTTYWGCVCNEGYAMNENDECVPVEDCDNCVYNGVSYEVPKVPSKCHCQLRFRRPFFKLHLVQQ